MTMGPNKTKNSECKDPSQDNLENVKYDSISAITKDTRVYMLYEANRAYPAYIVKYQYQQLS